jgi:hypothetical protein
LKDQVELYRDASSQEEMEEITYKLIFDNFGIEDETHKNVIKTVSAPVIDYFVEKILWVFIPHKSRHGPMVQASNNNRWYEWTHFNQSIWGFKDGVVRQTGANSKIFQCDSNLSSVETVYYYNWTILYSATNI